MGKKSRKQFTKKWDKTSYQKEKHVVGLVDYISSLGGDNQLGHKYEVVWRPWVKALKQSNRTAKIEIDSIEAAFDEYFWNTNGGASFDNNLKPLTELSKKLKNSIAEGNECDAFFSCIKILDWGGVYEGAVNWVAERYEKKELCNAIKTAVEILDGEDTTRLDEFKSGNKSNLRLDSGLTKIYSLASQKSIIYDDRVGAGLGLLVRKYLEKNSIKELPEELDFMPGRDKNQNASNETFVFKPRGNDASYIQARSNLLSNWLIERVVNRLNEKHGDKEWVMRKVEAALFMIGYRVS